MPGMTLPPGFRFHPTDEELVDYYLKKRVKNIPIEFDVIADVDLYKCEPWDLPSKSKLPHCDNEWFFFSPRDRKYPNGSRTNRATEAGYWKATGRDRTVRQCTKIIGMKKTLVFYRGRAPHGGRTDWLMHEYRLDGEEWENMNVPQDAYVLCRVFKKNGLPKNPSGGSGSMEEGDQVDSPGDVKSSAFADIDVKPSMSSLANLPRLVQSVTRSEVVSGSEGHGANGAEILAMRSPTVFSEDPFVHSGSFRIQFNPDSDGEGFFVDEGLDKVRNDEECLEEFYNICPPLEGSSLQLGDEEILNYNVGSTKYVQTEFNRQWQEQVAGAYQAFGGHILTKPEEFVLPPMLEENDFDFDGPLPTLVQVPSPPTASPSFDENDTESSCVSSSNNNFATIRIRPRPSPVTSPLVGNHISFTAPHRILRQIPTPQMAMTVTTSPSVMGELAPKLSVEQKPSFVSQKEKAETELDQSLDSQAPTSEMSQIDSEVASSQDNSWAANVVTSPVPEVSSDDSALENNNSPVAPAAFVPLSRKSVVNPLIPSKPGSEGISSVHTGAGNLTALPSGSDFPFQKSAVDEVLEKEVCSQDSDSGVSSVTQGSTQGVDQLNHCHTLKTAEAVEKDEKDAETFSPTKKSLVNESNSTRIMGLRLLEPICVLRECSTNGISASKQNMTSRKLPPGIGSIHVNAVTVTCSCSSAGLPHVPTKACACYTTFWEKEIFTKGESSVVQGSEHRNNPGPTPSSNVGFVTLGILLAVLFVQLLSVVPAHFAYFSREHFSLSSRDLLFILVGAVPFFLVQRSSVPGQLLRR